MRTKSYDLYKKKSLIEEEDEEEEEEEEEKKTERKKRGKSTVGGEGEEFERTSAETTIRLELFNPFNAEQLHFQCGGLPRTVSYLVSSWMLTSWQPQGVIW